MIQKKNSDQRENILLARPLNTSHFEAVILESLNRIENDPAIKLVVVDSIVTLYRSEFLGRKNLLERQNRLMESLKVLANASSVYDIAVLITNQTQSPVDFDFGNKLKSVGGNVIGHMTTYRLELKRVFLI